MIQLDVTRRYRGKGLEDSKKNVYNFAPSRIMMDKSAQIPGTVKSYLHGFEGNHCIFSLGRPNNFSPESSPIIYIFTNINIYF